MKIKNYVVAAAILGVSLFTACSPNSLEDNEEPTLESADKSKLKYHRTR